MISKNTLIAVFCLIINTVILVLMLIKSGTISREDINTVATAAGPVVTIIAIWVAYITFENQRNSNRNSQSTTVLNQLLIDASDIRRGLDATYLVVDEDQTETGRKAAKAFMANFKIAPDDSLSIGFIDDMINSKPFQLIDYMSQLINQLEQILQLARNATNPALNENDQLRSRVMIQSVVTYFFITYKDIFDRIAQSLLGKRIGGKSKRIKNVESVLYLYEDYSRLMRGLELLGYFQQAEEETIDIEEVDNIDVTVTNSLQERINSIDMLDVIVSKNY